MAGEVVTIKSTLTGYMVTAQADLMSMFQLSTRCVGMGWSEPTGNGAAAVNFPVFPAPSATSEGTEANATSNAAITVSNQAVTLGFWPAQTSVSKLAIFGGNGIPLWVTRVMGNNVAAALDTEFCSIFTGWTPTVSECTTLSKLMQAVTTMRNSMFVGNIKAVLGETQAAGIIADAGKWFIPNTNEDQIARGRIGSIVGVGTIQTVPDGFLPTSGGNTVGGLWMDGVGVGESWHDPIVQLTAVEKHAYVEFGVTGYYRAEKLSATGGVQLLFPTP